MNKMVIAGFFAGLLLIGGFFLLRGIAGGFNQLNENAVMISESKAPSDESADTEAPAAPSAAPAPAPAPPAAELTLTRGVSADYQPGQPVDVTVTISYTGPDAINALGLSEKAPVGWTFQEVTGGDKPVITPKPGETAEWNFAWIEVPKFPCTFTYRAVSAANAAGPQAVAGQGIYRKMGPELRSPMTVTTINQAAAPAPAR